MCLTRSLTPRLSGLLLVAAGAMPGGAAAQEIVIEDSIVIESAPPSAAAGGAEIVIEPDDAVLDRNEILIDAASTTEHTPSTAATSSRMKFRVDDAWLEYGHLLRDDSGVDSTTYGKIAASVNAQPSARWEWQLAARLDMYDQSGDPSNTAWVADFGDTFVRYRGDDVRLTLGTQTVVWGRIDELPPSDRVSRADLSRYALDELPDRRRATPALRAEAFFGAGKLDAVWLYDFRPAELPDSGTLWYPVNQQTGRVLGVDPEWLPPALVRTSTFREVEPDGDGGFGLRYTLTHSAADFGLTLAHTRQSIPYFRYQGGTLFETVYPWSWAYGADVAFEAAGATWRFEAVYSSDNPVTRTDPARSYTTVAALNWAGGVEFHPGDGDARVNLQLVGLNLLDAPSVIDREEIYSFNGEVAVPFDRNRWRANLRFFAGLDAKDVYLNPEIAFLGWEPHEFYLELHYFDGEDGTPGDFYADNTMLNLGWRASF
jgi:hypothetical protein